MSASKEMDYGDWIEWLNRAISSALEQQPEPPRFCVSVAGFVPTKKPTRSWIIDDVSPDETEEVVEDITGEETVF